MDRISVFGLGKLGCTMLACFAHKGWQAIGVDINEAQVDKINDGISPIYEPMVAELIAQNKDHIKATINPEQAVLQSDTSFIIVPTPSLEIGSFSTEYVESAIYSIGKALALKHEYHLVVVTSTVMPGDTDRMKDLLEKASQKKCGVDFGICYNPDFIALGRIVHDFLNPDMVLIGQSDDKAGLILENIHKKLSDNDPAICRMAICNAELAKIALNAYCTMKITFANVLAEICENMPNGNADDVTNAIGLDSRIGRKYFRGGLSYSGPCFSRDNRAFTIAASSSGVQYTFSPTTDMINDYQRSVRIPSMILRILREKESRNLSILGLTYKEDTTIVEESPALYLIRDLVEKGINIKVYDPAGMEGAKKELRGIDIEYCDSAIDCISGTSVCLITTPWKEFKKLTEKDFVRNMQSATVYDAWGLFEFKNIDYRRLGRASGLEGINKNIVQIVLQGSK